MRKNIEKREKTLKERKLKLAEMQKKLQQKMNQLAADKKSLERAERIRASIDVFSAIFCRETAIKFQANWIMVHAFIKQGKLLEAISEIYRICRAILEEQNILD